MRGEIDTFSMLLHRQGGDHTSISTNAGEHRWSASQDMIILGRDLARV